MGCCTLTTLNKVNIKGVEYDLGGSGGDAYRTMNALAWTEYSGEVDKIVLRFDFDYIGSNEAFVDWSKPVRIDLLDTDGSVNGYFSLNVSVYNNVDIWFRSFREQAMLYNLSHLVDGCFFSSDDTSNYLIILLHIQENQDFIEDELGGVAERDFEIAVHYVPVNEYSPILSVEQ